MIPDITDNRLIFMAIHDDKYKSDRTAVTATTFFDKIKFERAIDKIRLDCGEENVVFFDTVMQKYVFMPCYTIQDTDAEWEMCMSDADMLWVIEHDIIRVITNSIVCTNQDELFARIPTEYRRM